MLRHDGAFAPTRETGEGVLGSGTESFTVDSRSEWASKAANQQIRIGIVDDGVGHGRRPRGVGGCAVFKVSFSPASGTRPAERAGLLFLGRTSNFSQVLAMLKGARAV
jgi:hypothetical protein